MRIKCTQILWKLCFFYSWPVRVGIQIRQILKRQAGRYNITNLCTQYRKNVWVNNISEYLRRISHNVTYNLKFFTNYIFVDIFQVKMFVYIPFVLLYSNLSR